MIVPNETRRGFIEDAVLAGEVYLDTPFGVSKNARLNTPRDKRHTVAGVALKSANRTHFGRLSEYNEEKDRVVVLGDPIGSQSRYVWIGSVSEYCSLWEVD